MMLRPKIPSIPNLREDGPNHLALASTPTVVAVARRFTAVSCRSYRECPQHRTAPILPGVARKYVLSYTVRSRLHWIIIPARCTIAGTYGDSSLTTTLSRVLHLRIHPFPQQIPHFVAKWHQSRLTSLLCDGHPPEHSRHLLWRYETQRDKW